MFWIACMIGLNQICLIHIISQIKKVKWKGPQRVNHRASWVKCLCFIYLSGTWFIYLFIFIYTRLLLMIQICSQYVCIISGYFYLWLKSHNVWMRDKFLILSHLKCFALSTGQEKKSKWIYNRLKVKLSGFKHVLK